MTASSPAGPDPSPWLEAARRFAPAQQWLAPGPRLFAPPADRAGWLAGVRAALAAHPGLRADLERQAAPREVRPAPTGNIEPRQWSGCLPAAALLALVDGGAAWLDRVRDRVPRLLAMDDWVPPHHAHSRPLDLSAAGAVADLALYLDFARDLLSEQERAAVAGAIAARGVRPFVEMTRARSAFWTTARHNWPTVIAGEVGLGLLAAWETVAAGGAGGIAPADALAHVVERIAGPLLTYPADGSYEEGPGYWHYGVGECLPLCEALCIASAGSVDLFSVPFLARTGEYGLHVRTPDGGCFDVEDGAPRWAGGWMLAVLGRRTGRDDLASDGRATLGTAAGGPALRQVVLVGGWGAEAAAPPPRPAPMACFPGTQNIMLRSDWSPGAFFAGLHAGSNTVNHAHLDLGTFSVVAGGARVLGDAGSWSYTLDYFSGRPGGTRWDYEPNTTAGHNALLVDGQGQDPLPAAVCRFHQVDLRPERQLALASVNLTAAYGDRLSDYVRHFAYFGEGLLVVVDLVAAGQPHRLTWCAHPAGAAEPLDGNADQQAPQRRGGEGPPPQPLGWRWQAGGAAAELQILALDDHDGFVLAETRRHTRYRERTGRPRAYTTQSLRAETLHRVPAWHVVAALRAGPAGALPGAAVEAVPPSGPEAQGGGSALAVRTAVRRGTLSWADGTISWTEAPAAGDAPHPAR